MENGATSVQAPNPDPGERNDLTRAPESSSRRTIVKRTLRLAYAAPLVIATMKIVTDDAEAQVIGITRP